MRKLLIFLLILTGIATAGLEIVEDRVRIISPDASTIIELYRDSDNSFMNWLSGTLFLVGGPVVMQDPSISFGDDTSPDDVVLNFLTSGNDGTITYDQSDDEFDFDNAALTTTGIISGASVALSGLTPTRIIFVAGDNTLTDDADLTFVTDTLTTTKLAATTMTGNLDMDGNDIDDLNAINFNNNSSVLSILSSNNIGLDTNTFKITGTGGLLGNLDVDGAITVGSDAGATSVLIFKTTGDDGVFTYTAATDILTFDKALTVAGTGTFAKVTVDSIDIDGLNIVRNATGSFLVLRGQPTGIPSINIGAGDTISLSSPNPISLADLTMSGDLLVAGSTGLGDNAADTHDLHGVTTLGDGGTTNNTRFSATGVLTMAGTARVLRSVDFEPDAVKKGGVGPTDSAEAGFPIHDYQATNDESVHIHWEIPHDYASAGEIHFHVEFFVDTAPGAAANVTWGVEYQKLSIGDNFNFGATTTVITNTALTTGTPANDKKIHSSTEIHLTTTGFEPMDVILIRIFRDANASEVGATDNFANDARVFNYHLMYLSDKLGQGS